MKTLALPPYISFVHKKNNRTKNPVHVRLAVMSCPIKALFSNYSQPPKFE